MPSILPEIFARHAFDQDLDCSLIMHNLLSAYIYLFILQLLVGLVSTYRYRGEEINASLAQAEAKILHNLIKQKTFDHDEVIRILCTRSKAQLNATFNCYKDEQGTSITKV